MNRLVRIVCSSGRINCTDTTFISSEMRVVVHIMIPCKDNLPDKIPKDILIKLYEIARELKVPKFGLCYYHTVQMVEKDDEYDTENFYLKFRK